jgi:hypothetical protein
MSNADRAKQALPEYAAVIDRVAAAVPERDFFGALALAIFEHDDGAALGERFEGAGFTPATMLRKWVGETRRMRIANNRDHQFRQFGNGKIRMFIERAA